MAIRVTQGGSIGTRFGESTAMVRSPGDRLEVMKLIQTLSDFACEAADLHPRELRIVSAVIFAELQERPHDLSSLAEALGLSRTTLMRRVGTLAERGLIAKQFQGRRCMVRCTDEMNARFRSIMDEMIDHVLDYAVRVRARQA